MKANNPILTNYVLNELDPHERAQFEQQLSAAPQTALEVEQVRKFGRMLGSTLAQETAATLTHEQRAEILKAAGASPLANEKRKIVEGPSWWRTWEFGATAAACMVFGFGAYAIFDALTETRPRLAGSAQKQTGEMLIGIPRDDADSQHPRSASSANSSPAEPRLAGASSVPLASTTPPAGKLTVLSPHLELKVDASDYASISPSDSAPAPLNIGERTAIEKIPAGIRRNHGKPLPDSATEYTSSNSASPKTPLVAGKSLAAYAGGIFRDVASVPVSALLIPSGTASHAEIASSLKKNQLPRPEQVRIDEMLQAFSYEYRQASAEKPVALDLQTGPCPWNQNHRLLRVGIRTRLGGTREIVAENVGIAVEFNSATVASYRLIGYEGEAGKLSATARTRLYSSETITTLYEIAPANAAGHTAEDIATITLGHTLPGTKSERSLQVMAQDAGRTWATSDDDFRWAASVATFGMLLRSNSVGEQENWQRLGELFRTSSSAPLRNERAAFAMLAMKAATLAPASRGR